MAKKDVLSLAWADMSRRRFATAIKLLESKADTYEDDFEYYITLGIACLYVGDFGASSAYFQRARKLKLTDTRLLLGQAAIFLRRGDTDRALQYYLEICDNEPDNKIAKNAIEFIRTHGDYDVICRWVDTGRIEQFYPPIGVNPEKIAMIAAPVLACILGAVVAIILFTNKPTVNGSRANLTAIELTSDEISSAKEKDLSTQSVRYILTSKEITKHYTNALQYFQEHRDNAAQVEVNMLLNSDAALSIKQKANILTGYFEIPDFDTITDVPAFVDVMDSKPLYQDCWVDWGGKVSNAVTNENGSYSCDLLVGNETLDHYEGVVNVRFESVPKIATDQAVRILGQIDQEDGKIILKGRAVYQSVRN